MASNNMAAPQMKAKADAMNAVDSPHLRLVARQTKEEAHAITARNARESPLLRLPPELRNLIFAFAYTEDGISISGRGSNIHCRICSSTDNTQRRYPLSAMLLSTTTCRQMYVETQLLPFRQNYIFKTTSASPYIIRTLSPAQHGVTVLQISFRGWRGVDLFEAFPCFMNTGLRGVVAAEKVSVPMGVRSGAYHGLGSGIVVELKRGVWKRSSAKERVQFQ